MTELEKKAFDYIKNHGHQSAKMYKQFKKELEKEEKQIQEKILQEQWQEEQETKLLYEEMRIQNYDFDYGDVKY